MKIILILTLLINTVGLARDGVNTGNGGGLSEMNMVSVWQNLKEYNEMVLSLPSLSKKERNFLLTLNKNKESEPKNLIFTNPRTNPEVFNNISQVYATQKMIGSKIYINQDQLFKKVEREKLSLTLTDSYVLILEILNTRYHNDINNLISSARVLFDSERTMVNLNSYGRRDIGLEVIEYGKREVILTADENRLDITQDIIKEVGCTNAKDLNLSQLIFQDFGSIHTKYAEVYFYGEIQINCDGQKIMGEIEIMSKLELLNIAEDDINLSWVYNQKVKTSVKSAQIELYNLRVE